MRFLDKEFEIKRVLSGPPPPRVLVRLTLSRLDPTTGTKTEEFLEGPSRLQRPDIWCETSGPNEGD